ncbi:inactive serine/threonine-protein kinase TEX14-like [Hemibagrus wyckioides]|uniref:inactive serine/threonine-protein kinase TEX14-like n=1 Tax=Hemibagrus wyckioides TaxID=337641 RepID=UPI00266D3D38|nr:inactive serine/threonine-protein kinase TEX14-like [Hemibagrus wyckioides]
MSGEAVVPCPVLLGSVKTGGLAAQLHRFTRENNLHKAEKLLKQGVDVDCINHLGQTSLFCTCLLGFTAMAELLLQYGADPNHRCGDRSTPVHAAVFSCNTGLLSKLLEAGGDLRLHDKQGRTPRDWAEIGGQKHSARMVGFIKSCMSIMRSLSESQLPRDRRDTPTPSKTLLHSTSLPDFLRPVSDAVFKKKVRGKSFTSDTVQCFGFGKLCVEKPGMSVGALASVPFILESELLQAEDEVLYSFSCGSFTEITNYIWRGSRVSVKELQMTHQQAEQHGFHDLLITELSFCCRLFHPHLLQLMAVSFSYHLQQHKLVYERVHVSSLYTLLYHQRAKFPVLKEYEVLSLILQVCEALFYLDSRSLVLRSLSSHSVLIVHPGVAKVTGLGFMVPSNSSPSSILPIPMMLYNWAAPEVILMKSCTGKADLYSICALIQELYTDAVPWGSMNPRCIKQAIDTGEALSADPSVPQPYYDLLVNSLNPRAEERTCSLQDLRYTLRSELRVISSQMKNTHIMHHTLLQYEHKGAEQDIWNQELDCFQETPTKQKSTLGNFQKDVREGCLSTDRLLQDISLRNILPLDERRLSPCPPSVEELDMEGEKEKEERYMATQSMISNHICNTARNLKESRVLLQQVESSLELTESRMMGNTCSSSPEFDETDGQRENKVVVLKAVGPPSKYRPSSKYFQEMEDTEFCSAGEESFKSSEAKKNSSDREASLRGGQEQGVTSAEEFERSSQSSEMCTSQELTRDRCAEYKWSSEVNAAVARVMQGFLSTAAGVLVRSSDSEEVQEEQQPLMDVQEDKHLEQLFQGFAAGMHSESEESRDFHTINHTFTLPTAVFEKDDLDYASSPVEPSTIFYTPKHNPENTKEELSQTSSSEDDPDVTLEVCRPNVTIENTFRECGPSPVKPQNTEEESVSPSVHTTRNSHMADMAELSSITCSPAQLQECVGQNEALPSPHNTHLPACNSTPRSPHTFTVRGLRAPHREVCVFPPVVLHLQSVTEPSPWGSAKSPSHIEMYNMTRLEHGDQIRWSEIGILSTPTERGDLYLPSCGNSEFTRASSGVRNSEENKSQEEGGGPAGKTAFKHTISMSLFTALSYTHTHTHCYTVVVRLRVIHIIITVPLPVNSGSLTSFPLFSLQINMIQACPVTEKLQSKTLLS